MPIFDDEFYLRTAEWRSAAAKSSQLLVNCLESIDASLWLIAGGRSPQALVLLLNSIEIAFKAELERIHRVLIADSRRLDYSALKSLLRDAFLAHPRGHNMSIPEFDMDRTITFGEAMERVKELYPSVATWRTALQSIYNLRNDVVHYGANNKHDSAYADGIATVAIPFLDQFLGESQDVSLEKLVTSAVFRELRVARQVYERLKAERQEGGSFVLGTVRLVMLYTFVDWPQPIDRNGWIHQDDDAEDTMASAMRDGLSREWDDCFIERECQICGSLSLFVRVAPLTPAVRSLAITAAKCPKCGLSIRDRHRYLAEYHVGPLTTDEIEGFLKDIGE